MGSCRIFLSLLAVSLVHSSAWNGAWSYRALRGSQQGNWAILVGTKAGMCQMIDHILAHLLC